MKNTAKFLRSKRHLDAVSASQTRKILVRAVRIWRTENFLEALEIAGSAVEKGRRDGTAT
jgi:hypothetical protein